MDVDVDCEGRVLTLKELDDFMWDCYVAVSEGEFTEDLDETMGTLEWLVTGGETKVHLSNLLARPLMYTPFKWANGQAYLSHNHALIRPVNWITCKSRSGRGLPPIVYFYGRTPIGILRNFRRA